MIPGMTLIEDQLSVYNARRSGVDYNSDTLLKAITDLGPIETVVYLSKGMEDTRTVWLIDQDVTFPENLSVLIPCGVVVQVELGITLTFEGQLFNQCVIWHTGLGNIILNSKTAINTQSYSNFFDPFIVSGGIHGLSPTCFSPNFATEAYASNGQYVREPLQSINYGNLGANCIEDWVWVIISSFNTTTIPGTSFINVPNTHYYIDYVSDTRPILPPESAYLMEVHLQNDQIVQVNDLRALDAVQGLLRRVPIRTWTPILTPGTYSYAVQSGTYIVYGRLIYVEGYIVVDSIPALGSGLIGIANLPYEYALYATAAFTLSLSGTIKGASGPGSFSGLLDYTTKLIYIVENIVGKPPQWVDANRLRAPLQLLFTGTYLIH
jgi:hypothetical protein